MGSLRRSPGCSLGQVRSRFTVRSVTIRFPCSHLRAPPRSTFSRDDSAVVDGGLVLGGVPATELVRMFGTPLLVYDEATLRAQARAYRVAAPGALVAYGTKAFPSLAVLRLFAQEGLGADVSTSGELEFALRAGLTGERLVIHGNNKEDELLRRSTESGALIVLDSLEELERARALGGARFLIRVTPGIEADTHEAIRTAQLGSKFGLPPEDAVEALRLLPEAEGLHVHVGSQLLHFGASLMTVEWVASFAARARAELGWTPRIVDLGGGLGVRHVLDEPSFAVGEFVRGLVDGLRRAFDLHGLAEPRLILEPGRSLVSRAGVTLYSIGGTSAPVRRRPTSPSTGACPTIRGPRCTPPATPRSSRTARPRRRPGPTRWPESTASRETC